MGLSSPLGISRVAPARKNSVFGHIINLLSTKLVQSRWFDIGLCFIGPYVRKKRTWSISSHLGLTLGV